MNAAPLYKPPDDQAQVAMAWADPKPFFWRTLLAFLLAPLLFYALIFVTEWRAMPSGSSVTSLTGMDMLVPEGDPELQPTLTGYGAGYYLNGGRSAQVAGDVAGALNGLERPALLIPRVRRVALPSLNGIDLIRLSPDTTLDSYAIFQPHLFEIKAESTARGGDLRINIQSLETQPYLAHPFLGELDDIRPAYQWRRFVTNGLMVIGFTLTMIMAFVSFGLAFAIRRKFLSLSFAVVMVCWAIINLRYLGVFGRFPPEIGRVIYSGASFMLFVASFSFVNEWTFKNPIIRRIILPILGVLFLFKLAPVFFISGEAWSVLIRTTDLIVLFALPYMFWQMFNYFIRYDDISLTAGVIFLASGFAVLADIISSYSGGLSYALFPRTGVSLHYGPMLSVAVAMTMAVSFVQRFLEAQKDLASINDNLADQLAAREAEIADVYAQRAQEMRDAAQVDERKRIMRDMHDGVGGRLLSLSLRAKRNDLDAAALTSEISDSLQELRLMVDSLDTAEGDLEFALGALRGRIEPLLREAGIELFWDAGELGPQPGYGPRDVLSIYRIVQEATSNIIRHAGAKTLDFVSQINSDGEIEISITDDGQGLDPNRVDGKGLGNIETRAVELGGTAEIGPRPDGVSGTRLTLHLPQKG